MSASARQFLIGEQNQEYAEAVAEDVEKARRQFMDQFYALSGEAFLRLGRREKGLIRTWQISTRLSAPEERKLVGMSESEIAWIQTIPTLHLWSETSACRNISDEQIRQRQWPMFVTVAAGYVFCFDALAEVETSLSGNLMAKIPIQTDTSDEFIYLELALTLSETDLVRSVCSFSSPPKQKRHSDLNSPTSSPKKQSPSREIIDVDLLPDFDDHSVMEIEDDHSDEDLQFAMALQSSLWETDSMQIDQEQ